MFDNSPKLKYCCQKSNLFQEMDSEFVVLTFLNCSGWIKVFASLLLRVDCQFSRKKSKCSFLHVSTVYVSVRF